MTFVCFCNDIKQQMVKNKLAAHWELELPRTETSEYATFNSENVPATNMSHEINFQVPIISKGTGMTYMSNSHSQLKVPASPEVRVVVGKSLTRALETSTERNISSLMSSISIKLSPTCKGKAKSEKKVRFDDNVTIYTIPYSSPKKLTQQPDMYLLAVTLREIWPKLDLDRDGYLNMTELKHFCSEVWNEFDLSIVMARFAKTNPEKGMNFHEWCSLCQEEEPEIEEFVEDLYYLFVEPSSQELIIHVT